MDMVKGEDYFDYDFRIIFVKLVPDEDILNLIESNGYEIVHKGYADVFFKKVNDEDKS